MGFVDDAEDGMETEGAAAGGGVRGGAPLKIASDAVNARVTKASKAGRAEAAAAAVRHQQVPPKSPSKEP